LQRLLDRCSDCGAHPVAYPDARSRKRSC
jgi:hypothetical protein